LILSGPDPYFLSTPASSLGMQQLARLVTEFPARYGTLNSSSCVQCAPNTRDGF